MSGLFITNPQILLKLMEFIKHVHFTLYQIIKTSASSNLCTGVDLFSKEMSGLFKLIAAVTER